MFGNYFLVGLCAGLLSGLFGVGGGLIVVPALCWLFIHFDVMPAFSAMKVAIATSLAIMIMTLLSALMAHSRQQAVRWDFFQKMVVSIALGTVIGTVSAHFLKSWVLRRVFGVFMLITGMRLFWVRRKPTVQKTPVQVSSWILQSVSVLTGMMAGLLGISGGVMLGPFFLRSGMTLPEAAGTSVVCGLVIGVTATLGFMMAGWWGGVSLPTAAGYIYWPAFLGVSVASMLSAPLGVKLGRVLPRSLLRRLFGVVLLGVSMSMFFPVR